MSGAGESAGNRANPLLSIAVLGYNQERYIREAVESVLAQEYQPLEVILSDDCSRDGTFGIIEELAREYRGPHTVIVNRNERNVGLCAHVNRVVELSHGSIVMLAGGDDLSLPGRAGSSARLFRENPGYVTVNFRVRVIDSQGRRGETFERDRDVERSYDLDDYCGRTGIMSYGASLAFRRRLFTDFGPIDSRCPAEDLVFVLRGLMAGGKLHHSVEEQVLYRRHEENISSNANWKRLNFRRQYWQHLRDLGVAVNTLGLAPEEAAKLKRKLRADFAEREATKQFLTGGSGFRIFFRRILFSSYLSPRLKWSFLRKAVRGARRSLTGRKAR